MTALFGEVWDHFYVGLLFKVINPYSCSWPDVVHQLHSKSHRWFDCIWNSLPLVQISVQTIKPYISNSWLFQYGQDIWKTKMDSCLPGSLKVKFCLRESCMIAMFHQSCFVSQYIKYKWRQTITALKQWLSQAAACLCLSQLCARY